MPSGSSTSICAWCEPDPAGASHEAATGDLILRVKAVPGASRDCVAGPLGDRLKVRVAAAPEGGRANKAIIALLARAFDRRRSEITLVSGATNPEKVFRISNLSVVEAIAAVGADA